MKYDNCWAPASDWVIDRYTAMRRALNGTGRSIVYSLCEWGVADPWTWAPEVGAPSATGAAADVGAAGQVTQRHMWKSSKLSTVRGASHLHDACRSATPGGRPRQALLCCAVLCCAVLWALCCACSMWCTGWLGCMVMPQRDAGPTLSRDAVPLVACCLAQRRIWQPAQRASKPC